MDKETKKPPEVLVRKKKKGMSPFRRFTTVIMIGIIMWVTYEVYLKFGIGDGWVWVKDVLTLILIMGLVFLAAVFVVWLLMLFRKYRGEI